MTDRAVTRSPDAKAQPKFPKILKFRSLGWNVHLAKPQATVYNFGTKLLAPDRTSPVTTMPPSPAETEAISEDQALHMEPPVRHRVADHVFDTLTGAILKGQIKPGDPLPTQRELAKRFNISALVVRQAIHRLEDLGLVRVRQGSTTIVLDKDDSSDIRLIQLRMEMIEPDEADTLAALESQLLFLVPMLILAERRITTDGLAILKYLVRSVPDSPTAHQVADFRTKYWSQIGDSCGNPLFRQMVLWYRKLAMDRAEDNPAPLVLAVYEELNARLADRTNAAQFWTQTVAPVLDAMDQQLVRSKRAT